MKKSIQRNRSLQGKKDESYEYEELLEMMDSGMEDQEIAAELGVSESYVTRVKNEVYKDLI